MPCIIGAGGGNCGGKTGPVGSAVPPEAAAATPTGATAASPTATPVASAPAASTAAAPVPTGTAADPRAAILLKVGSVRRENRKVPEDFQVNRSRCF